MGKHKRKKKKIQITPHDNTMENNGTAKNNIMEIISFIVSCVIILLLTLLATFVNIEDKPSTSAITAFSILIILSSGLCIFFFHLKKPAAGEEQKIQNKLVAFCVCVLIFGIGLLSFGVFQSKQMSSDISKMATGTEEEAKSEPKSKPEPSSTNSNNDSQEYELSTEQALLQAEMYYEGQRYESLVELYSTELLKENPIALNNLGYMYSKGIYFKQNNEVALRYYERASEMGLHEATHNLISLKLHNCITFGDVVDALKEGFSVGDYGTFLFLGSILQGRDLSNLSVSDQTKNTIAADIKDFFESSDELQADILSKSLGPVISSTKIKYNYPYSSQNIYEEITSLGTTFEYTKFDETVGYVTLYNYLKGTRSFLYDNLMQESFVSTQK